LCSVVIATYNRLQLFKHALKSALEQTVSDINERELVTCFSANGLRVTDILTLNTEWRDGDSFAIRTYACEKVQA
jgi:hypothetical protein